MYEAYMKACINGDFDQLKEHYDPQIPICWAINYAAGNGHLEIVKWLCDKDESGKKCSGGMHHASSNGHLHVMKWLHENKKHTTVNDLMVVACKGNHLHVAKWLHENIPECEPYSKPKAMKFACENGNLDMAKWIHENIPGSECSFPIKPPAMKSACKRGHLEVVKWVHQNIPGEMTYEDAMQKAGERGHLEVVKWLCENIPLTASDIESAECGATEYNHPNVVEWLKTIRINPSKK